MHHKPKHSKHHTAIHHNAVDGKDAGSTTHRWLLPVLLVAQLMVILDITAVNIALPHIATDLQLSGSTISWTITSYSLIFGSLLLFGGRAADLLGRRRMFLTGLGVFTASSFASAMAGSAAMLFASRAGQGLGAAILSPAALSIITSSFHGAQRAKALSAWGAVGGAGAAIGVLVGGVLTQFTDWRTIFYVNLPVAAVAAHRRPEGRPGGHREAALARPRPRRAQPSPQPASPRSSTGSPRRTPLAGLPSRRTSAGSAASPGSQRSRSTSCTSTRRCSASSASPTARSAAASCSCSPTAGTIFGLFLLCSLYLQNVLGWGRSQLVSLSSRSRSQQGSDRTQLAT